MWIACSRATAISLAIFAVFIGKKSHLSLAKDNSNLKVSKIQIIFQENLFPQLRFTEFPEKQKTDNRYMVEFKDGWIFTH